MKIKHRDGKRTCILWTYESSHNRYPSLVIKNVPDSVQNKEVLDVCRERWYAGPIRNSWQCGWDEVSDADNLSMCEWLAFLTIKMVTWDGIRFG